MITNMTEGKPSTVLLKFSLPMLLSIVFQQLYNIADSVIAGKFISIDALAAVGASYPVTMIFMAIATGMNISAAVIISQFFGAKQYKQTKTAIYTSIISAVTIALILTLCGALLFSWLMQLLQTPNGIFSDCKAYLDIYIFGLGFLFLYNICTGIFTALGDSRTPLYFVIGSSVGNILLDILFVTKLHLGVPGVALATFLCQGIAAILAFICLMLRIRQLPHEGKNRYFSFPILRSIMIVSIPSILQQSFVSVGNLFIQGLVNSFDSSAILAGYSAAIKLNTFAVTSFTALGNSMSSFTAQNIGAKKPDRVKKGLRVSIWMLLIVSLIFTVAYSFFGNICANLFIDPGEADYSETLRVAMNFLKIVSPFYFVVSLKLVIDGVLRGAGAMAAFMTSTFSDLILRVVLSYLLSPVYAENGIWISWPIGWIIASIVSCLFYFFSHWQKKSFT